MKSMLKFVMCACMGVGFVASANAADKGTKTEAVALVNKAIAYYKSNGKDKAFVEINNKSGQFVDRDMYVYVLDDKGVMLAHGANEKLIGKDLIQVKDADGKHFSIDLVALIKDKKSGWVDYKWPNPVTKQIEAKTSYLVPVDGMGFAVGIYK